ncbi:hypothetical protein [Arcticibacter sp. MXS-1]|uniref:IS1096 element passenger TnpR family protein n=1 Tax=Arcticibacter sp. MXS-1 TaxID=3341726 RepID=UPI0035A87B7E
MAIYRFRVSFEDYDDVVRDIDIKSTQTFEDLHLAIHKSTGYNPEQSSSFFVSNDQWIKGDEIALLPSQRKIDRGVTLMKGTKLSRFIDDPHQKFYYIYNFDRPFDFHVELVKILDDEAGKEYPYVVRAVGDAPKATGPVVAPAAASADSDDEDFLNDTEYGFGEEDTEDMETVESVDELSGTVHGQEDEEEEEKDEFMDEFSDNENYDSDDYNNKEDY